MIYSCPVCGVEDETAYLRCYHPNCTDGRDVYGRTLDNWNVKRDSYRAEEAVGRADVLTFFYLFWMVLKVIAILALVAFILKCIVTM